MSFAIPEELLGYVDERVQLGEYGNTSEYLRDLIDGTGANSRAWTSVVDRRWARVR